MSALGDKKMIGTTLNARWKIREQLSDSGQSITYLADDKEGKYKNGVVIKKFKKRGSELRNITEIKVLSEIKHQHILQFLDTDLNATELWYASPYYKGGGLENKKMDYRKDREFILRTYREILEGVAFLHQLQPPIVHRDLKPANILLKGFNGPAVVADFGIIYIEGSERPTFSDEPVGPRNFMAPELEDGRAKSVTLAADVYSLGKLLYWMCAGRRIFSREKHRHPDWDLVAKLDRSELEHVNRLLDRMVLEKPEDRFKNATEVLKEFDTLTNALESRMNAVSRELPQTCQYCGIGRYREVAFDNNVQVNNFLGNSGAGAPRWCILVCEDCGHVQMFRLEEARQRKNWWGTKD
jgi:serine/threonine protein kinase